MTLGGAASLALSTGDFEISMWAYWNSVGTQVLYEGRPGSNGAYPVIFTNSSVLVYFVNSATQITGPTVVANQWYYITVSRVSGTTKMFVNGSQVGSNYTDSTNYATGGTAPWIGAGYAPGDYMNGYISNLRVVVGSGVASQTVPTTPLTAITNTKLLTCQSNRFVDNSASPLTLTINGTPSVQAFSPFAPTAAYDAAVVGGSGYFDGSGDNLTTGSSANLAIGTNDFCIEWFYYQTNSATSATPLGQWGGSNNDWILQYNSSNFIFYYASSSIGFSYTPVPNQWTHGCVCRSGSTMSLYLNGVRVNTKTDSTSIPNTRGLTVGANPDTSSQDCTGYISNARIVVGSSVYNPSATTLTVPTAPLTAVTGTKFLLSATNAGIFDSAAKNDLETVGNAQVSTTQAKWGTTSMYFDGTGDYLISYNAIPISSGDFTIECWVYMLGLGSDRQFVQLDIGTTNTNVALSINGSGNTVRFLLRDNSGNNNLDINSSVSLSANTWYHIAGTVSGTSGKLFINGSSTDGASGTVSGTRQASGTVCRVGVNTDNTSRYMYGYIDDVRLTKGYARYTSNFTPATAAFPLQ